MTSPGSSPSPGLTNARPRQPEKVKIFFVEDFVAEPDMALRGPGRPATGVAFLLNQGKQPIQSLGISPAYGKKQKTHW